MRKDKKDPKPDFPDTGTVLLSHEAWEDFTNAIENPKPAPEGLKKLMRREPPWSNPATK